MKDNHENILRDQVTPYSGCTIVVFGASGDLAKKKLFPSLYQLYKENRLPKPFHILGYARTKMTRDEFLTQLKNAKNVYADTDFLTHVSYMPGPYSEGKEMASINEYLDKYSKNRIFYLSLPPSEFRNICTALKKSELITENSGSEVHKHTVIGTQAFSRIVIEKPFGEDHESATKLKRFLVQHFAIDQIFAIDHYLGKEPIQNIMYFRFTNSIFENIWNGKYIESIELYMDEDIGVDKRAGYFDSTGLLRDMVQSHGLQLLALVMMEPPTDFSADQIQVEKSKLISSLTPFTKDDLKKHAVRAQYEGYLHEEGVSENSHTETFVALKTYVRNWRWAGTPIYMQAGKALGIKKTEVVINFKSVPYDIRNTNASHKIKKNRLVFRIQPDTYIKLRIMTKVPSLNTEIISTDMDFPYDNTFKGYNYVNGYDKIIYSSIINDATLFLSIEEQLAQWKFIDSMLGAWSKDNSIPLYTYQKGSEGPEEAHMLLRGVRNATAHIP